MDFARPRRWKLATGLAAVTLLYWLTIFVGTHVPGRLVPHGNVHSLDKIEHLVAFAGLAVLLCGVGAAFGLPSWRFCAAMLGLIAVYGAFDELTQVLVIRRTPDLFDWLADVVGAGLGIGFFLIGRQLLNRYYVAA